MIIELLIIYLVYLLLLILGSYYVNLYISKDQFTKEELKDILPYISQLWSKIINNHSVSNINCSVCTILNYWTCITAVIRPLVFKFINNIFGDVFYISSC